MNGIDNFAPQEQPIDHGCGIKEALLPRGGFFPNDRLHIYFISRNDSPDSPASPPPVAERGAVQSS